MQAIPGEKWMTAALCGGLELSGRNMDEQISNFLQRRSVAFSQEFPFGKKQLWQLISKGGNLNQSHPFCKENNVIAWDENNHTDRLVYLNGLTYIRQFLNWNEDNGYDLIIGTEEGPQSYVIWEISEISENKSSLTITVYPYLLEKMNKIISFLPFIIYIRPKLKNYLKSVLNGFFYFSSTGKSVPRNYWGKHSWFS